MSDLDLYRDKCQFIPEECSHVEGRICKFMPQAYLIPSIMPYFILGYPTTLHIQVLPPVRFILGYPNQVFHQRHLVILNGFVHKLSDVSQGAFSRQLPCTIPQRASDLHAQSHLQRPPVLEPREATALQAAFPFSRR